MSDRLVVNFASMQQASSDIQRTLGALDQHLGDLERSAAPLVNTWTGDAKQAYSERQETWRRAAADLTAILGDIKRALDDSAVDYADTERRNASLFR